MSYELVFALVFFGLAATGSFVAAFGSRSLALRLKIVDRPTGGRKIHDQIIPLLGGLGIGLTVLVWFAALIYLQIAGMIQPDQRIGLISILGFLNGILILMIGGFLDDKYDLPPRIQFVFTILAALSVVLSGTSINEVTNWFGGTPLKLGLIGLPLAFGWIMVVTYSIKFFDGLNGLVSGQVVIGGVLIALLSLTTPYYQPVVALMAAIIAGAYLGFLPHNFPRAKQFLGESGSLIAGFSLAFLSIVGGAKLATGLMALGFPLIDAVFVVIGRMSRGASPFKGDDTHLHFKLLKAGLSQKQTVLLIWGLSAVTGAAALGLQSIGKVALVVWIIVAVLGLSAWAGWRSRRIQTKS
ncbi:undecaprenyl/decaprenyl-phosphate alpha-N-acetylglucosaminyl 1-phosphate transferase [Patescibacteria group bacterium]|jgi:UDP-GlcNAc:undecaprenyl-phosphate GlcNAc-1-phosphate transferase|nr:undecaprenyl/decaprenyl-phosphate alpha-N-acetylglucosaminyl 1-phosphate transferase [Patescibacteria group bacterium]